MRRRIAVIVAFLAVAALLGVAVGETLHRPDRLWARGFYADLFELQMMAALLILGGLLLFAIRIARPAIRPLSIAAVVCFLATTLPFVMAVRRPAVVALELAAKPRLLDDTRAIPNPDGPFVAYIVGDTGHVPENGEKVGSAIARRSAQEKLPIVGTWLLGDLIEDRNGMGYERARFECLETPMRPLTDLGIPLFGVIGNHDYEENSVQRMIEDPILNMGGMNHYKRVFGKDLVSVFVIDSEILRHEPEQIIWLRHAVATDKSRWRILMLHHPLVGSDLFHGGNEFCLGATSDAIYGTPGIDAVITGHNHFYERRNPIGNTTHVTVGSGSRKPKRNIPEDADRAAAVAGQNVFLEMTVDESALSFRAFNRDDVEVDSFQIRRDPQMELKRSAIPVALRHSVDAGLAPPDEG